MSDSKDLLGVPLGYGEWLLELKQRIRGAQSRAVLVMNEEQIRLYHSIGLDILERQNREGWGANIVNRLSTDLREAFPSMKGFSSRNLQYMRRFAQEYPDLEFVQQAAAKLAWFHIVILLTKVVDRNQREWYAIRAGVEGWSRTTLELQIKNHLYDRQGSALTNFERRLAEPQASLAAQVLKDPYHSSRETIDLIEAIKQLMMVVKGKMRSELPKIYSQDLLNNLFRHPYTKIEFVVNELQVTRKTAAKYLDQLVNLGLLQKHRIAKESFYLNVDLYELLLNVGSSSHG